jgi:molecular chaperone DnaK
VLLLDATPLSFGIETLGAVMTPMIPKNTTVPTARSETFSTAADNQTSVEIHVLQGERPMAADNKSLGRFILDGIPPSPRGVPQVEVTFDIDTNGILSVTAIDKATKKKQSIRIEGSTGLSKDEIERLRQEAELHMEEDKKKKESAETKNLADNLVYQAEKSLRDWGDKVAAEVKEKIQKAIDGLKAVKEAGDVDKTKSAMEQLSAVLQEVGKNMYASQPPNQTPENQEPEPDAGQEKTDNGKAE